MAEFDTNKTQKAVWQRFEEVVSRMSAEQLNYVNTSKVGIEKKKQLNDVFIDWLFELHKNEFVAVPQFNELANGYVDTIVSTAQEYLDNQREVWAENERLKAEIEELKKRPML
jgi:hypothetical protein